VPTQIVFRNIKGSPALEQEIRGRALELEALNPRIIKSRILVEVPHRHHEHGNHVHVRIEVALPGVTHEPSAPPDGDGAQGTGYQNVNPEHRFAVRAVHEAFDKARRRLERVLERAEH
jgi:ribosome-associated translation inhibitor RaiA